MGTVLYCTTLAGVGYIQSKTDQNPHNFLESSPLVKMPNMSIQTLCWCQRYESFISVWQIASAMGLKMRKWLARGVLGISSDGDDRRIFLGLKVSIPGFFWVRKFGTYFFG